MEQSFTQLLPPPASVTSPSLEASCDIVLPPPEESLYTLPRRKHTNAEFETLVNRTSNQTMHNSAIGKTGGKTVTQTGNFSNTVGGDQANRSVRFESISSPTNTPSISTINNTSKTSNSNSNKATNGTHSESSV